MRILMLAQAYRPFIGGEERYVEDLSTELASRGYQVAVLTLWHESAPPFEISQGVRVYRVRGSVHRAANILFEDSSRGHGPPFPDPELVLAIRRIIALERPHVVHAHDWIVHSFLPLKAWSKARLVMHLHDYSLHCAKKTLLYGGIPCSGPGFGKCLRCGADHYGPLKGPGTVLSNWGMGILERATVDMFVAVSRAVAVTGGLTTGERPYRVIPNFVPDYSNLPGDETVSCLAELPKEDYLLFVGGLSLKKGIDVLFDAYAELSDPPPLVLIGYTTKEYPIDFSTMPSNVTVLRDVPDHVAVMAARGRSLMALIPSRWAEPFGIVALEAMASGRPVIAARHGGLADTVVDGETGLLVSPGDAEALRRAIEMLLNDPVLRDQMGQAAKRRLKEYEARAIVPRVEAVYEDIVQGGT